MAAPGAMFMALTSAPREWVRPSRRDGRFSLLAYNLSYAGRHRRRFLGFAYTAQSCLRPQMLAHCKTQRQANGLVDPAQYPGVTLHRGTRGRLSIVKFGLPNNLSIRALSLCIGVLTCSYASYQRGDDPGTVGQARYRHFM